MDYDKLWDERVVESIVDSLDEKIESLKQQLAEKDEELAQIYSHLGVEAYLDQQKQALKEIENLKKDIKSQKCVSDLYLAIASSNATKMSIAKATRHQVCEEIIERLGLKQMKKQFDDNGTQVGELKMSYNTFMTILDQIEQGE